MENFLGAVWVIGEQSSGDGDSKNVFPTDYDFPNTNPQALPSIETVKARSCAGFVDSPHIHTTNNAFV